MVGSIACVHFASEARIRYDAVPMAADKATKRKRKAAAQGGPSEGSRSSALRQQSDPRQERRFEPKASALVLVSVIAMSVSGVLLGAGAYGQWLRGEELGPHKAAPYLLFGGVVVLIVVALFGRRPAKPVRVGDAGMALEKSRSEIERIEWRDVKRLLLGDDMLTVQGVGTSISFPRQEHGQAAARVIAEAQARIPKRLADIDESLLAKLEKVDDAAGELLPLEAPQVAGVHCKASEKLIAFEKDARVCGRCGEVYHRDHVPSQCLTCDAPLTA